MTGRNSPSVTVSGGRDSNPRPRAWEALGRQLRNTHSKPPFGQIRVTQLFRGWKLNFQLIELAADVLDGQMRVDRVRQVLRRVT